MTASKIKLSTDHVLKALDDLRDRKLLCDVHLVAEGAKFPAHRVVLAATAPYFQAMFTGGFKENQMSEITLNDTSSEGLKCVLDAIYTGELSLSAENVCDIIPLANQLQLNEIVEHCGRFLAQNVSTQSCLSFLSVAEKYDLLETVDECNKFALENFDTISQSTEFRNLSKAQLCNYLPDNRLKTYNGEIEVFRATLKWFQASRNNSMRPLGDSPDLAELMQHVRFPLIPSDLLLDEVLTSRLISENPEVMKMVREALRFHTAENLYSQPLKEGKQFQPRGEQNLVPIQNVRRNTESGVVRVTRMHMLNTTGDEPFHTLVSEQVLPRAFYCRSISVVTKGNYLFMFGVDPEYWRETAVRFDVKTNAWLDLKPPPYDASTFTTAALLKGKIYLIGGMRVAKGSENNTLNPSSFSASFLQYSIETNSWSKLQNLPTPVTLHSSASYENYVFCAGGYTIHVSPTDRLYAYDVVGKIWLSKSSMNFKRAVFSLEALGPKLVACGGRGALNVEIYDIADDQWTLVQNGVLRHNEYPATVALNGSVYIIGGLASDNNGTISYADEVSIINVDNGTIRRVSSIPFKASGHSCALLTIPNSAPKPTLQHK